MLRSILAAGAALVPLSVQASDLPFPLPPMYPSFTSPQTTSSLPLLSGTYVFSLRTFCQPHLTVTYNTKSTVGSNIVSQITLSSPGDSLQEGTLKFVQSSKAGSGTVTITSIDAFGSPFLVENSGVSGSAGTPLEKKANNGSTTFTQTATTIALKDSSGTSTYNVYYGNILNGVVQVAVFGGIDDTGCAEQGTAILQ